MPAALSSAEQSLVGFLSNEQWDALLADVNQRVERIEAWPEDDTRQQVFELLNGIDAMHREALRRLVRLFKEGVLEQVVTDPAIHTLMELYDLLPELVPPPEAALPKAKFPTIPIRAVPAAPSRYPHWVPALGHCDELAVGELRDNMALDGRPLLLARRGTDEWYALDGHCAVDGAPLHGARLSGYTLSCPRHVGCHYDLRNGARVGGGTGITCHPVRVEADGRVLVGLDMDFKPSLPSF
jgi:nitrite reductase/ring-hydroxylating ferredoxin subunit